MEESHAVSPHPHQPASLHASASHPLAIATAVIVLPLLLCLLAATFILVNLEPKTYQAVTPANDTPAREQMQRFVIGNATERQAVCNDGSPATYYYRPGTDADADNWIIYLEGLGYCADDQGCLERVRKEAHRTSSLNYPDTLSPKGILSILPEENPDFSNYNHVYIKYCSSDYWSGDLTRDLGSQTIHFKGKKILGAVVEDLQTKSISVEHNLNSAEQIIFAGSAAGAVGVSLNLDSLATSLPKAEVTGIIDGAWFPELTTFAGSAAGFDYANMFSYWNSQVDTSCAANNKASPWECLSVPYGYGYLKNPAFVYVDQTDETLLEQLGVTNEKDSLQAIFIDLVRSSIRDSVKSLSGVFAPDSGSHTALVSDRFTDLEIDGQNYQATLSNWYFGKTGVKKLIQD
jgi:hypothetical protein